jgi:hypothetical protein
MGEPIKLYGKLAKIAGALGYLQKQGTAPPAMGSYSYVREGDITAAVGEKLAAEKVLVLPSLARLETREAKTSKGMTVVTTAHVTFSFIDAESGERLDLPWAGEGADPFDKGLSKAYTNALKYMLLKAFQIATGDDPEADDSQQNGNVEKPSDLMPTTNEVEVLGTEGGAALVEALDKVVDRDRMRLAATHVRGFDIGDLTDDDDAAECLGQLTLEQVYRLRAWAEKKAEEAKA